jgi:hypothetical protein
MSKLTAAIKNTIGTSKLGKGGGQRWYWLCDKNGDYTRGQEAADLIFATLKSKYECWKLVSEKNYFNKLKNKNITYQFIDYFFIVKDKRGMYHGAAHISSHTHIGAAVVVDIYDEYQTEQEFHESNINLHGVISYEKV